MLESVEVRTTQGTLLQLPLEDMTSGIFIDDIEGLGPVKTNIVTTKQTHRDGERRQSSSRESRTIKLRLGLQPDYIFDSVSDLRNRIYGFLMPSSIVSLRFIMSDGLSVDISGEVESCEPAIFTKEPAIDVIIMCFDPDFVDQVPVTQTGTTTDQTTETTIRYDGSVETGFELILRVNRTLTAFTVYNRTPDNVTQILDFANPLSIGDVLTISTIPGAKGATLLRANNESSRLYAVSTQSSWIKLKPGINYFRIYSTGAGVPYDLLYTKKYGGL